jgi:hypothetical protein
MEDRILINGTWYIKEDTKVEEPKDIYEDLIFTRECLYSENGLELSYSVLDKEGEMVMPSLLIIKGDYKDEWDNEKFLTGLIDDDDYSKDVISQDMRSGEMKLTYDDIRIIRQMLIHIKNKGLI